MKQFIKKNIKYVIIILICLTGSVLTTYATNYLFNSNQVRYDNSNSGIISDNVQDAIDELFADANDYSTINGKIGNSTMGTTATTITGAIAEHEGDISSLNNQLAMFHNAAHVTDLNEARSVGNYWCTNTESNRPADNCIITVDRADAGNWVLQTASCVLTNKQYKRVYNNGTWSSWVSLDEKMATKNVTSSVSFGTLTTGSIVEHYAYRSGNMVHLLFVFKFTTAFQGGQYVTVPLQFSDSSLAPIARTEGGGANNENIQLIDILTNPSRLTFYVAKDRTAGQQYWITITYMCVG